VRASARLVEAAARRPVPAEAGRTSRRFSVNEKLDALRVVTDDKIETDENAGQDVPLFRPVDCLKQRRSRTAKLQFG
jgi:hypothetical protein